MSRKISVFLMIMVIVFGVSKLSFAMMCGGHKPGGNGLASDSQSHSQHQRTAQAESSKHRHTGHQASSESTSGKAVNIGNKICPVSGEKISEKMKATYEYKGKIYNFCCPMCIEDFKKDPRKYIKKVEEELQAKPKKETTGQKMQLEHGTESAKDKAVYRGHKY